jgi:multidrug efflux system membrane fusion protein
MGTESSKKTTRNALIQRLLGVAVLAAAAIGGACSGPVQQAAPPPPEVTVSEVICRQVSDNDEFTGRLEAVNAVELRPRVSGYLQGVHFREGEIARQGDLLFQIDPRPFQAEVDRLRGELAQAKAESARAQSDFQRAERLHNNDGMSAEEYDRRAAARGEAEAKVAATQGALRGAELNLEFTHVVAPITGRVGRAEITEGNLVESGGAQVKPLTTIVSLDPIYVYFDVDEQTYLKYARVTRTKSSGSSEKREARLGLADEVGFPHVGEVNFVDNQVSSTTGTIRVRATFANKNFALTPGLFARVRLQGGGSYSGCLAKDDAVVTDLNQKYVYVLSKDNKAEYRAVDVGPMNDGLRVFRKGLHEGDVIVVSGLQRVRPGSTVTPKRAAMGKMATRSQPEAAQGEPSSKN